MPRDARTHTAYRTLKFGLAALFGVLCLTVAARFVGGEPASGGMPDTSDLPAQVGPQSPRGSDWQGLIQWRTGAAVSTAKSAADIDALITSGLARGTRHYVAQFDQPVGPDLHSQLESIGMTLLSYLGNNAFFASVSSDRLDLGALAELNALMNVEVIDRSRKLHPILDRGELPTWAVVTSASDHADEAGDYDALNSPVIAAYVKFHGDVSLDAEAVRTCLHRGALIRSKLRTVNALVIELPYATIPALADQDAVQWIEPALPLLSGTNDSNRQITQADDVQVSPYGLDGSGVSVLVYDVGAVDPDHPDFAGRLTLGDGAGVSGHSTHVGGTVGGDGADSGGLYRGMAPGASLISYALGWGGTSVPLYTDPGDIESDYHEAIHTFGVDLATNSIGTNTCRNGFNCEITGDYGVTASVIDAVVAGGLGEPIIVLWANGNERGCNRCRNEGVTTPEGYHSTAPPACAKNQIGVGAVNSNNDTVTFFTSWGPADDGRLKPDVVGPGCQTSDDHGVTSCAVGGGYETHCGTSMAAPTVAGLIALLLQDLYDQFPDRPRARNSTLKVLLAHNAVDLGNAGPDYQSGYGSVRIRDTIDFARTGSFFEDQATHGGTCEFLIAVDPNDLRLKVTLAWDDVPGTVNVDPALVNDLDLCVYDPSLTRHFPWTLDPDSPGAPATRTQPDHVNNLEQVLVEAPAPGLWSIRVCGFNVPDGPQPFSICASPNLSRDCDGNQVPDDEQILADPNLDCTGNGILDICEPDCNGNGVADSCDIADGVSTDCDDNGVPDECQPDCNGNGVADSCDIMTGSSEDCDADGVPDECQDTSADCNENGVWDACDIAEGTSADENHNGVPDECEENRTIYVDDDGPADPGPGNPLISDPNEDGSLEHPYDAIQEALNASLDGDVVVLADGQYAGPGNTNLDFYGKAVVLCSATGPQACVIDCEGVVRGLTIISGETSATRIEGLTIRDGYDGFWGGAIFCENSSPTVVNCIFEDNWAVVGGAVYMRWSDSTLTDCVFANNWAGFGGGMFVTLQSSPTITACAFSQNTALLGGGALTLYGGLPRVLDCRFVENDATGTESGGGTGGALLVSGSPVLNGCLFRNNVVSGSGGAMYSGITSRPTLTNCAFIANAAVGPFADGGGICSIDSSPTLTGCTFTTNQAARHGGGFSFAFDSRPSLSNCILWGNTDRDGHGDGESAQIHDTGRFPSVRYCCIQGLTGAFGGVGNIGTDPLLVDPASGDYHLSLGSPCVNAGDPDYLALPDETDLDGDPRVLLACVDIGADEFVYQEVDCNNNGVPDDQDIADGTSPDCNQNDIPDECELAFGLAADCNGNDILDDCDLADGTSEDCSGNGVPDECEPDCNDNGEPDDCDILGGVSEDCNQNGIPDECDPDCNGNGIADECDLAAEESADFNNNGIPDECEVNRTIHVDDDGPHDPGPGVTWSSDPDEDGSSEHPFDAIQEAVYASIPGDVVMLADGTYAETDNRNIRFRGRAITVRGENGPRNCIINCEDRGRGFFFGSRESSAAHVDGVTITNGSADYGGAVYCDGSSPTFSNCILVGNTAWSETHYGGGAFLLSSSSAVISNCLITGNWGRKGGAIFVAGPGSPEVHNCTVTGNHANVGGGIACRAGITATIVNTVLWSNVAETGPQLSVAGGDTTTTVSYCNLEGGQEDVHVTTVAQLIWGDGNLNANPRFVGGPAGSWTSHAIYHSLTRQTTLTDANAAWPEGQLVGKLLQPDTTVYVQGLIAANTSTTVTVWGRYSSLGVPGVAYQIRDNHLNRCSPCIDAGDNTAAPPLGTDLDGSPRLVDDPFVPDTGNGTPPLVDIGSYEYQASCPGDLSGDSLIDSRDLLILLFAYGIDDAGDLNCNGNTELSDLAALLSVYGAACE